MAFHTGSAQPAQPRTRISSESRGLLRPGLCGQGQLPGDAGAGAADWIGRSDWPSWEGDGLRCVCVAGSIPAGGTLDVRLWASVLNRDRPVCS